MAIEIEILEMTTSVRAAFYYPVPPSVWLSGSVDQSRTPAGNRLSPAEVQELKDGTIHELIFVADRPAGTTTSQVQAKLEVEWDKAKGRAKADYVNQYGAVGTAYDGGSWT